MFFLESFFIHANVQGFKEAAVLRGHFGVLRRSPRQSDRGVQLKYDVEAGRSHAGNRLRDPLGIRNGVVDGVSQLSQQLLHAVVELQGGITSCETLPTPILGRWQARNKPVVDSSVSP